MITLRILIVLILFSHDNLAQLPTIKGKIIAANDLKTLAAMIYSIKGNAKKKLAVANDEGQFVIKLDKDITMLSIEMIGYRSLKLPIYFEQDKQYTDYFIELKMLKKETQEIDKPYDQTLQNDFVLTEKKSNNTKNSYKVFTVVDAQTLNELDAKILFFFTQKSTSDSIIITKNSKKNRYTFRQNDIVAFEVMSAGYETYAGNMIISSLDNITTSFSIFLSKIPTLLVLPHSDDLNLKIETSDGKYIEVKPNVAQIEMVAGTRVKIHIMGKENNIIATHNMNIKEGLNFCESLSINAQVSNEQIPHTIHFSQSSFLLSDEARKELWVLAQHLKVYPSNKVLLVGYTEKIGNEKLNRYLSEFRAKTTADFLISNGIDSSRIITKGLGSILTLSNSNSEEERQKDRRVEILILQ